MIRKLLLCAMLVFPMMLVVGCKGDSDDSSKNPPAPNAPKGDASKTGTSNVPGGAKPVTPN